MKKRLFALTLAGVMALGNVFCAAAEEMETVSAAAEETEAPEEEIVEVTMDMLEEAAYAGIWVSFEGGFDLYLPGDWDVLEIAEEDAESGVVFRAIAPDETGSNIEILANEVGSEYTLEDVLAEYEAAGFTETGNMIINGIPAVHFQTESTLGVAFLDNAGIMYNVQVGPPGEETEPIAQNIFFSLSRTESPETETD